MSKHYALDTVVFHGQKYYRGDELPIDDHGAKKLGSDLVSGTRPTLTDEEKKIISGLRQQVDDEASWRKRAQDLESKEAQRIREAAGRKEEAPIDQETAREQRERREALDHQSRQATQDAKQQEREGKKKEARPAADKAVKGSVTK